MSIFSTLYGKVAQIRESVFAAIPEPPYAPPSRMCWHLFAKSFPSFVRFNLEGNWMSGSGTFEYFVTFEDTFYWMSQSFCKFTWAKLMGKHIQLSAESSANHGLDQMYLGFWNAKSPCNPVSPWVVVQMVYSPFSYFAIAP